MVALGSLVFGCGGGTDGTAGDGGKGGTGGMAGIDGARGDGGVSGFDGDGDGGVGGFGGGFGSDGGVGGQSGAGGGGGGGFGGAGGVGGAGGFGGVGGYGGMGGSNGNICPNLNVINAIPSTIQAPDNSTKIQTRATETDGLPMPLLLTLSALWGTFENTENIPMSGNVVGQNAMYFCERPGPVEICVEATDGLCVKTLCTTVICPEE